MLHHLGTVATMHSGQWKITSKVQNCNIGFQKTELYLNEGIVQRKLKGKDKRVKSSEDAWKLFKTTLIEAQIEYIPQVWKATAKSK